ncbi:deoxyribodipyrimidine photo-lyase [Acinetobacter haemolyticus]|uniref:deoxyribodipyrimidine photo-lyase n=1 Tax=Acinetobacter haemolyticus TaxID=29430 RepID=UPI001250015C|nr:deoxyribodipyrimidine photo-lyase [Acinetobacter haemolyticus]NAR54144.1 deoxyribodipyrimidine photo-lyase [Acinetobacter haemolyticus]NAR60336.1 deoxyribodipyrimidine photo-lyase [Acinetobacter haemolyticus]NAR92775.1 deoxyribodipyrimidine photo-lyase [Acinetobacter haemolyticus]QHI23517.1 deoxyribodipyrimidine photo-lyase [Acinetobacter haemolyticus]
MQSDYQLIWFRQDLRIHDHAALWHATQTGPTVALVILSPEQWQLHDDAPIKIDFYLRQLQQLQIALQSLNIPLIVQHLPFWKDITQLFADLMQNIPIQQVYANIELGVNELKRDNEVQKLLHQQNKELVLFHDRTLFPVASIRNQSHQPYQVFSAFKKVCYQRLQQSLPQCYPVPDVQQPINIDPYPSLEDFKELQLKYTQQLNHLTQQWPVGEPYALTLLDQFIYDRLDDYKNARDFPAQAGTSQLSAYLNIGILSIRQCLQALFRKQHGDFVIESEGQQTWLDELLWREFYQHILFDYPRVSKHLPFQLSTQKINWRDDPVALQQWQQGHTGIPIVDAGMRQLLATGWMHNRVRMICAMFLSKNLLIDWRKGEQWFMQHLIDGDLAANNGGWQWCASTGTDAAPYFRIFNPISQSQKFDPNGDYLRQWIPELAHLDAKSIHEPHAYKINSNLNYPIPIVDLKSSRARAIAAFKE